jgi:hypothetical protein
MADLIPHLPDLVVHVCLHLLRDLDWDFGLDLFDFHFASLAEVWGLPWGRLGRLDRWRCLTSSRLLLRHNKVLLVERLEVLHLLLALLVLALVSLFDLASLLFEPCFFHALFQQPLALVLFLSAFLLFDLFGKSALEVGLLSVFGLESVKLGDVDLGLGWVEVGRCWWRRGILEVLLGWRRGILEFLLGWRRVHCHLLHSRRSRCLLHLHLHLHPTHIRRKLLGGLVRQLHVDLTCS